jgi:hypothetical protein
MMPTFLPLAVKASAMSIDEALPVLLSEKPALKLTLNTCRWYRQMGVGFLLMFGTPARFFEHLFKSGRCFLHFLEANDDGPKVTSKAAPLFDAIACNDRAGAALIAARARQKWNPDLEYEDDFLYVHFLIQRFFLGVAPDVLAATLRRYEDVLEGQKDFRLGLCKALLGRDQAGFDAAVEALVDALEAHYDKQRGREVLDPDEAATTVHVSTELLAWLRLAGEAGLATLPSYPMAPDIARGTPRAFPAPDAWKVIERYTDIL